MQGQVNGAVGLATLEAARPLGWRAAATEEYEGSWPIRHADLRADLSARIVELTGRRAPLQKIYTDGHLAVAGVDGATFRLYHGGDLVLVRTCAYCATDHFESPQIATLSDLGYALSAWRPLHEDCEDYSSEELPDF
ncbi:MAG: hypothetical protein M3317_11650 [Actinomycetota bacterium]|nr:hypothetical protein [Actinomycetota bacterium]